MKTILITLAIGAMALCKTAPAQTLTGHGAEVKREVATSPHQPPRAFVEATINNNGNCRFGMYLGTTLKGDQSGNTDRVTVEAITTTTGNSNYLIFLPSRFAHGAIELTTPFQDGDKIRLEVTKIAGDVYRVILYRNNAEIFRDDYERIRFRDNRKVAFSVGIADHIKAPTSLRVSGFTSGF